VGVVVGALPPLLRGRINAGLANMKDGYAGHVQDVSVQWLEPGVTLHELRVERPRHKVGAPFLVVQRLEVEIVLDKLFDPRIGLRFVDGHVSFVDGPTRADQQWGPSFTLRDLREKLPFDLRFVQLANTEVHLRNFHARPPLDAYVHNVELTIAPLDRCIQDPPQGCHARATLRSTLMAGASLRAQLAFRHDDAFALDGSGQIRRLILTQVNPTLIHYAKLDIQEGDLDLDVRLRMRGRRYHFTLLPDFERVRIMGGERDKTYAGREMLAAMVAGIVVRHDEGWSIVIDGTQGRGDAAWKLERRGPKPQILASP
jgi:hypothetical protein